MDRPTHLRFRLDRPGTALYELVFDGIGMCVRSGPAQGQPDQNRWGAFRDELDRLGVWDWHPEYGQPGPDIIRWELSLDWKYQRMNVRGWDCYPESDGSPSDSPEYTRTFRRFLDSLDSLAGGRAFG